MAAYARTSSDGWRCMQQRWLVVCGSCILYGAECCRSCLRFRPGGDSRKHAVHCVFLSSHMLHTVYTLLSGPHYRLPISPALYVGLHCGSNIHCGVLCVGVPAHRRHVCCGMACACGSLQPAAAPLASQSCVLRVCAARVVRDVCLRVARLRLGFLRKAAALLLLVCVSSCVDVRDGAATAQQAALVLGCDSIRPTPSQKKVCANCVLP